MAQSGSKVRALCLGSLLLIPVSSWATTHIVFRYDDYSADRLGNPAGAALKMSLWEAEQAVDRLFQKYQLPYVVAAIPKAATKEYDQHEENIRMLPLNEDPEKVEFLRKGIEEGRMEVALHGLSQLNHVWSRNRRHRHGEFRERDFAAQLQDIKEGKRILSHLCGLGDIVSFVPPWDGWDSSTARALKEAGFDILSANRFYWSKQAEGLTVIPSTSSLGQLLSGVEDGSLPDSGVVVAIYHPEDILETTSGSKSFGLQRFEELLQKLSAASNVKVVTLRQLAATQGDQLTPHRFRAAVYLEYFRGFWQEVLWKRIFSIGLLPERYLPGGKDRIVYLTESQYEEKVFHWLFVTLACSAAAVFVGLAVRMALSNLASRKACLIVDAVAVVVVSLAIVAELHLVYKGYHMVAAKAFPGFLGLGMLTYSSVESLRRIIQSTRRRDSSFVEKPTLQQPIGNAL